MVHFRTKKLWVPRTIFWYIWAWPGCPHKTAIWECVYLCAQVCKKVHHYFLVNDVCICTCVHVYAHVYRCSWRLEEVTGSTCLCLPSTGITDAHPYTQIGLGNLNSGPRACLTNTNNWADSLSHYLETALLWEKEGFCLFIFYWNVKHWVRR